VQGVCPVVVVHATGVHRKLSSERACPLSGAVHMKVRCKTLTVMIVNRQIS